MAKSINGITSERKSRYHEIPRKVCVNQNLGDWNAIKNYDFRNNIEQNREYSVTDNISVVNKNFVCDRFKVRTKSVVLPIINIDKIRNYQIYETNHNKNKLNERNKSYTQKKPYISEGKIFVSSSYSATNERDKIINQKNYILNSKCNKAAESTAKNKAIPVYDEIHYHFNELLNNNKKFIEAEKDTFLSRKINNNLKENNSLLDSFCKCREIKNTSVKSAVTKPKNNSIIVSKPGITSNDNMDVCEKNVEINVADKKQLHKSESHVNILNNEPRREEDEFLYMRNSNFNYVKENENLDITSNFKKTFEVCPGYSKRKNPFQCKLNTDILCFFVNLKSNKDGMCLEWEKKNKLQNTSKCKSKSKLKDKCINYERQIEVCIRDDCVINNSLYQRSKRYFKEIRSKFSKCFTRDKSHETCQVASQCKNNIIYQYCKEKEKTPSKISIALENKKSLLKQSRSCNTSNYCKPSLKLKFIKAVQNSRKSKKCVTDIKTLDGSLFQIKIDPMNMNVINKRELRKKIKSLYKKKNNKNCAPTKNHTTSVIKGKAYIKNEISPSPSDCKGPLFEIKLDCNNMRILNLSEILHKIKKLNYSRQTNISKCKIKKSVNKCDSRRLREAKSKISCLWSQFRCKSENVVPHCKYIYYNTILNCKNPFDNKKHYRYCKKVPKTNYKKKLKARKKACKRKKAKAIKKLKKKCRIKKRKRCKKRKKKVKVKCVVVRHCKKVKPKKKKCRRVKKKKKQCNSCWRELYLFLADYLLCSSPNSKPKKCRKKPRRKRCEHIKYHCQVGHLRKSEISCLWLYLVCPSLYPSYLLIKSMFRNLGRSMLMLLGVIVWSPCVIAYLLCRILCCLR